MAALTSALAGMHPPAVPFAGMPVEVATWHAGSGTYIRTGTACAYYCGTWLPSAGIGFEMSRVELQFGVCAHARPFL